MKNENNLAFYLISTIEGNQKMFIKLKIFSCKGQEFTLVSYYNRHKIYPITCCPTLSVSL